MADDINDTLEDFEGLDEPAGKGGKLGLILIVLAGLGGGGFVGTTMLGDALGPILAERALNPSSGGGGHGGGGHGAAEGPSPIHVIDNLIVNPARSGGSRFLLASIAVEVVEPSLAATVSEYDVQIRSALILVLGAKTTDELTEIANRPAIIAEVERTIIEIMGPRVVRHVFIPQFVIQ